MTANIITLHNEQYSYMFNPKAYPEGEPPALVFGLDMGRWGSLHADPLPDVTPITHPATADEFRAALPDHEQDEMTLAAILDELTPTDASDVIAEILNLAGIPAISALHTGPCQGDHLCSLWFVTEDWRELVGGVPLTEQEVWHQTLRQSADLYAAWVWGDVVYWQVRNPYTGETDTCGGYIYTCYDDLREVFREAQAEARSIARLMRKEEGAKLRADRETLRNMTLVALADHVAPTPAMAMLRGYLQRDRAQLQVQRNRLADALRALRKAARAEPGTDIIYD